MHSLFPTYLSSYLLFLLLLLFQHAALELQQCAFVQPVISSHCPCSVTCTAEHGLWKRGKEDEREIKVLWEGSKVFCSEVIAFTFKI